MGLFRYTWKTFTREFIMLAVAFFFCLPLYLLVAISLKTDTAAFTSPLSFPSTPHFSNYRTAWNTGGMGRSLWNTAIITFGSVAALIAIGSLAAYALARRPSKLSNSMYVVFVIGIIFPIQLAVVPLYVALRHLHLVGTYIGMILLWTGLLMPLTVFLYTGFVRVLPKDYEEAAQVDGAGLLRTYVYVVFPLLRPITGTIAVLTGLVVWNDFFLPLIFLSGSKNTTMSVALYSSFQSGDVVRWNLLFAGAAIAILPMLAFYFLAQRQLIRGFAGGIRG
jgi:raffinose/stachyose/melibiose transport system permease protein